MPELQQIEQLVAIAEAGTLSAAAEKLHLSQSALSRSMQRLEAELGVPLFARSRNRIDLNDVGRNAVERARVLLAAARNFTQDLQQYAARRSTIVVGASAPAPLWRLSAELHERFPDKIVAEELRSAAQLLEGLLREDFSLILTDTPTDHPGVLCRKYVEDQLLLELSADHPLSRREALRISDLDGETVLVYRNLGVWNARLRSMSGIHFIEQSELDVLSDLVLSSGLPLLASTLFSTPSSSQRGRLTLPILGAETMIPFYLCAKEEKRALLLQLC